MWKKFTEEIKICKPMDKCKAALAKNLSVMKMVKPTKTVKRLLTRCSTNTFSLSQQNNHIRKRKPKHKDSAVDRKLPIELNWP